MRAWEKTMGSGDSLNGSPNNSRDGSGSGFEGDHEARLTALATLGWHVRQSCAGRVGSSRTASAAMSGPG
jgi:hypothetical protein